jgi:Barrel-sandwich domain of CusB or HlyD membrane-fusion
MICEARRKELVNLLNERDRAGSWRVSLDDVIESSKQRLRQWNVSDEEINALEKSRKATDTLVLRSPFTGVVEDVPTKQGMSVKMRDRLVGVMDLSRLWLWARPWMFANVDLKINGGEGLTVPVDAVLPTGSRSLSLLTGVPVTLSLDLPPASIP